MDLERLRSKLAGLLESIEILQSKKFHAPSLILLFSTIDILAWLDRNDAHDDVKMGDFLSWVDRYILPLQGASISPLDLYAARCSLLHSYSAESRLSRQGEAKELFYTWGTGKADALQRIIGTTDRQAVAVQIEDLLAALRSGTLRFLDSIEHSSVILERADKLFTNVPI